MERISIAPQLTPPKIIRKNKDDVWRPIRGFGRFRSDGPARSELENPERHK